MNVDRIKLYSVETYILINTFYMQKTEGSMLNGKIGIQLKLNDLSSRWNIWEYDMT